MSTIRTTVACALFLSGPVFANPETPPSHPERDYRAIGGDLYLHKDDDEFEPDEDGNLQITVFSHAVIEPAAPYVFDPPIDDEPKTSQFVIDGGALGRLRMQIVKIDCSHKTYEVYDARRPLGIGVWRGAKTFQRLAPLFQFACGHLSETPRENS